MSRYFERLASHRELAASIAPRSPIASPASVTLPQPTPLEQEEEVYASPPSAAAQPAKPSSVPDAEGPAAVGIRRPDESNRNNSVRAAAVEAEKPSPQRPLTVRPLVESPRAEIQEIQDEISLPFELSGPTSPAQFSEIEPSHQLRSQPMTVASESAKGRPESRPLQAPIAAAQPRLSITQAERAEPDTPELFEPYRPPREGADRGPKTPPIEIHIGSIVLEVSQAAPSPAPAKPPAPARAELASRGRFSLHRHYLRWE